MNLFHSLIFHKKLTVLIISFVFFSILYMVLDDNHFSGVNFIKDTIKKEVIKKKIKSELQETATAAPIEYFSVSNQFQRHTDKVKTDIAIEDVTKNVTQDVANDDLKEEKINVSPFQRLFDRAYFSMNTSCLLGYGDIFPISNIAKLISMIQSLVTVSIIVF